MALTRAALQGNQENPDKIDQMLEAVSSERATGGLFDMLNEKLLP